MAERRLIINADDFGITPGVSRGIAEAMASGVVTSASVMVNMQGWDDASSRLGDAPHDVSFGLHLNLVAGRPLTPARSLVDARTGCFHSLARFSFLAAVGALGADEIAAECAAQLDRLRGTGVRVTHADSHRHVHVLPAVANAIRPILRGLPLRRPRESLTRNLSDVGATVKKLVLAAAMGSTFGAEPSNGEVDHFVGISLQGSAWFSERLAILIDTLPTGTTELMVHPGYADAALFAVDDYTLPRERELASLMSPGCRRRLRQRAVELVAFGRCASRAMAPDTEK